MPPHEEPPVDDPPAEAPPVDDDAPPVEAPPADEPQPAEEARPRARRLVIDLTDASWSEGDEEDGDDLSGFVATSARRSADLPVESADEES